jgi:hypothetical protein
MSLSTQAARYNTNGRQNYLCLDSRTHHKYIITSVNRCHPTRDTKLLSIPPEHVVNRQIKIYIYAIEIHGQSEYPADLNSPYSSTSYYPVVIAQSRLYHAVLPPRSGNISQTHHSLLQGHHCYALENGALCHLQSLWSSLSYVRGAAGSHVGSEIVNPMHPQCVYGFITKL